MQQCVRCSRRATHHLYAAEEGRYDRDARRFDLCYVCVEHLDEVAARLRIEHRPRSRRVFSGEVDQDRPWW